MNKMISVCLTEDQIQAIRTDQMIDAVNRSGKINQARARERGYRRYIHRQDRWAKHLAFIRKRSACLAAAVAGIFCLSVALLGLGAPVLFTALGIAATLYASVLAGELMQEGRMAR
jgi:hypothetical protein